jgi:hypothetical protein
MSQVHTGFYDPGISGFSLIEKFKVSIF